MYNATTYVFIIYVMVVLLSLQYSMVVILREVIHPRMFPPFWFGGVTDWYQSIVYSELSISNHIRYTNYKCKGDQKPSDETFSWTKYFLLKIYIFTSMHKSRIITSFTKKYYGKLRHYDWASGYVIMSRINIAWSTIFILDLTNVRRGMVIVDNKPKNYQVQIILDSPIWNTIGV